jgi:hypothetical protein
MTKPFLCAVLIFIFALSTPAAAAWEQGQSRVSRGHIESVSTHQSRGKKARGRQDQRQWGDPYWTPCDYGCSWCTNGCG